MLQDVTNLNKKNFSIDSILLINLVFAFFPISFILGNFIININLILFCALGIFYLRSKILTTKFNFSIKIIFLLFFVIFISTSLSVIKSLYFETYDYNLIITQGRTSLYFGVDKYFHLVRLIKSVVFFRFFLMLIIVYFLSELGTLNLKYFFISAAFASFIVSLDVIYQYIFGFNIIGLQSFGHHNSGFFGDELMAGGFIQNLSFFSIFFVVFMSKNKKNLILILSTITICVLGMGIMLSGNRMPFFSFFLGIILAFLLNNKLRKSMFAGFICLIILMQFVLSNDATMKIVYKSFYTNATTVLISLVNFSKNDPKKSNKIEEEFEIDQNRWEPDTPLGFDAFYTYVSPQKRLVLTALETWKPNKIFGNGIKSFRIDCLRLALLGPEINIHEEAIVHKKNFLCSNHPHNYYLEILTETGIVGIFVTFMIALLFVVFILKNLKLFKENNIENLILFAATISLILAVFPIKSTGSIFSTYTATYITLISSIILSYRKRKVTVNR